MCEPVDRASVHVPAIIHLASICRQAEDDCRVLFAVTQNRQGLTVLHYIRDGGLGTYGKSITAKWHYVTY